MGPHRPTWKGQVSIESGAPQTSSALRYMCVCVSIHISVHVHVFTHTHIYPSEYACAYVCACVCACTCVHLYISKCVYMRLCGGHFVEKGQASEPSLQPYAWFWGSIHACVAGALLASHPAASQGTLWRRDKPHMLCLFCIRATHARDRQHIHGECWGRKRSGGSLEPASGINGSGP